MHLDFPYAGYEGIAPVEVPDTNLMGVWEPRALEDVDEETALATAFSRPIGAPRLREAVKRGDRILMLIDDGTRGTPIARVLPHIMHELQLAGVRDDQVALLTAPGTHRPMTEEELRRKLGDFYDRFAVHQHRWLDEGTLHHFGETSDGTPVTANRLLAQADFVLGLGSIVPHRGCPLGEGFSGGAKIAFPGVAGREMMERNQWEASQRMSETVMGVAENPMRLRMEEAARLVGLCYIVNLVSDAAKQIAGCFVGDTVLAHRAGCELSRAINAVTLPRRADIVVIDSYPADRDFWQSAKGLYAGTMAVREGGTLILVAPNPEGVAENHPNLLQIGYRPYPEVVRMVEAGEIDDVVGAAILADLAQIVDRADCIMVSPGVGRAEAERLGCRYAGSVQEALRMACERQGRSASVAVLRHGGHILPLIAGEGSPAADRGGEHEA